jgi:hypothetical protein
MRVARRSTLRVIHHRIVFLLNRLPLRFLSIGAYDQRIECGAIEAIARHSSFDVTASQIESATS